MYNICLSKSLKLKSKIFIFIIFEKYCLYFSYVLLIFFSVSAYVLLCIVYLIISCFNIHIYTIKAESLLGFGP